jgi:hypothetical protein
MKRLLIMFITTAMILGVTANAEATQQQRSWRTVQGAYKPLPSPVTGCNEVLGSWACMIVRTLPTERFVAVKVRDAHGLPVYFSLFIPGTGFRGFCGETKEPVAFTTSRDLEIEVGVSRWVAQTDCPASSVKTAGTITVTLMSER